MALQVKVGVLSLCVDPLAGEDRKGAAGPVVSMIASQEADQLPGLPAASTARTIQAFVPSDSEAPGVKFVAAIPELTVNGARGPRLPNTLSVNFPGVVGAELLARTPEICASTGAACHSTGTAMSATLRAIGLAPDVARGTIRLSLGWHTTEEEIDRAANLLLGAWESMT